MLSVTIYSILFAVLAYYIAVSKDEDISYGASAYILVLLFGRLFPYLILEDKSHVFYAGYLIEVVSLFAVYLIDNNFKFTKPGKVLIYTLVQPITSLAILSGNIRFMVVAFAGALIVPVVCILYFRKTTVTKLAPKAKKETVTKLITDRLKPLDAFALLVFTALYAVLLFYNLGSHNVPETGYVLSSDVNSNEIVLDLGERKEVSQIWIWLDYQNTKCSFSWYSENESTWKELDYNHELRGVFRWHKMSLTGSLRYLGMVFPDSGAVIDEIVLIGPDGNRIFPDNMYEYMPLFDEQDTFPGVPTYYDQMMFDEVYHARTAYEFINNYSIYETTHPPLGKIIMESGIKLFGMNPFGWRFMSAIFGILLIPMTFALAYAITGKRKETYITTILMSVGFMNYTLSRIGTIDIIVAVFILLMFYFMILYVKHISEGVFTRNQIIRLLLCGVSMGLAIATKWTGIYAAAGIAIMFFYSLYGYYKEHPSKDMIKELSRLGLFCVGVFILIPAIFYVVSYYEFVQSYPEKGLIQSVIDNNKYIFTYHSGAKDKHNYESEWYQWIIDYRPLLDSRTNFGDKISIVSTFTNPLICFAGIIALIDNIYLWRNRNNKNAGMLVIAYFSVLLPWLMVHRTVFIYQYFVPGIILVLMLGNSFSYRGNKNKKAWIGYAVLTALAVLLFIYFYPVISGQAISVEHAKDLQWFSSWVFS